MARAGIPQLVQPERLNDTLVFVKEFQYAVFLRRAPKALERKLKTDACPREKIENFEILGRLGRGGFATVFIIKHREREERYALKVQRKLNATTWDIKVATAEKTILTALDSNFIVKLHFAFQDAKNLYFVLEHAVAGDLARFRRIRFPDSVLKFFVAQIVLAIEYLHTCALVHRDLKSQNVLVFEDNYVKVADFGFCEKCEERLFASVGTSPYMAPEMFFLSGYGKSVDWWALGTMLYELRYKTHPFWTPGMTNNNIAHHAKNHVVNFPDDDPADLTSSVTLMSGLLEKDASKRFTAKEIKAHFWFSEILFADITSKRLSLSSNLKDLHPLEPMVFEKYDFLPGPGDEDPTPERFKDF